MVSKRSVKDCLRVAKENETLREFHCAEILFESKKYTMQTLSIPKKSPSIHHSSIPLLLIDFHISFTHQSDILLRLVDAILQASSLMLNDSTETSSPFQPISCGKTQWFLCQPKSQYQRVNPPIHFRIHWQSLILPNIGSYYYTCSPKRRLRLWKPIIFIIFRFHVKHC